MLSVLTAFLAHPRAQLPLLLFATLAFAFGVMRMVPSPALKAESAPVPSLSAIPPDSVSPLGTEELNVRVFTQERALVMDAGVIANSPKVAVERAEVSLLFYQENGTYRLGGSGRTDENGRLLLKDLPSGVAWLLVRAEGLGRGVSGVVVGTQREANVRLGPSERLTVDVADEGGKPISEATVLVTEQVRVPFGALTSAEGRATLSELNPSPWTVQVFARGYEGVTRQRVKGDLKVVLRRLSRLKARVLDAGEKPVQDARVLIVGSGLWPARQVVTDQQGVADIGGLYPGRYELKATKKSLTTNTVSSVNLDRGERREVVLRLAPGRFVPVRVEHETAGFPEAVPGAHAVLADYGVSAFPLTGVTNEEGKLSLGPVGDGAMVLSVNAKGFIGAAALSVPDDLEGELVVLLHKGATLSGIVTDQDGRPVEGARVEVIGTDMEGLPIVQSPLLLAYQDSHFAQAMKPLTMLAVGELGVTEGAIPFVSEAIAGQRLPEDTFAELPEDYAPWVTRFDGHFRASPVSAGKVRALVRHPAYVEGLSDEVVLGYGGSARVSVMLMEGAELTGRIVNEAGRPVHGARVRVTATRGSFERSLLSKADGRFTFSAVPAQVVVSLARPEEPTRFVTRSPLVLAPGRAKDVELTLPEQRGEARFVVVDQDGRPLELAQVTVTSLEPTTPLRETRFTDPSGAAVFEDLVGLKVRVHVSNVGKVPQSVELKAPSDREFTLLTGVRVRGRVTAVRGRQVVESARVELVSADQRRWSSTDALGYYEFSNVPVGKAEVRASHADYATRVVELSVTDTGFVDRAFEPEDIDLADAGSVRGTVYNSEGGRVGNARVSLSFIPRYTAQGRLPAGVVLSDEEGEFELRGVEQGTVVIHAYHPRWGRVQQELVAERGGEVSGVELTLVAEQDSGEEPNLLGGNVALTLGERDTENGTFVVVVHVAQGGEAARAGLGPGDLILTVDGQTMDTMREVRQALSGRVGEDVVVGVWRDGEEMSFRIRREQVSH